jgi:hypothetical protein
LLEQLKERTRLWRVCARRVVNVGKVRVEAEERILHGRQWREETTVE